MGGAAGAATENPGWGTANADNEGRKANQRILSFRECQVLDLVTADIATAGEVRSYRAIAIALGMSARHHVADTVRRLERRGLITRVSEGRGRRIVMNGKREGVPQSGA